jgi:hypothetical protein
MGEKMKWDFYEAKEFIIRAQNKPGVLYHISSILGDAGINIESITAFAPNDKEAIFRIITNDEISTKKVLSRAAIPIKYEENSIYVVNLDNKPGELAKISEVIYKNGINLNAIYVLSAGKKTQLAINSDDNEKLKNVLEGKV